MFRYRVFFYLGIFSVLSILSVRGQTNAQISFNSINNTSAASAYINLDLLISANDSRVSVWPENQHERGDVFFSFSPRHNKEWTILPGNNYTLKYRMFVYDETISAVKKRRNLEKFCHKPGVQHQKNKQ